MKLYDVFDLVGNIIDVIFSLVFFPISFFAISYSMSAYIVKGASYITLQGIFFTVFFTSALLLISRHLQILTSKKMRFGKYFRLFFCIPILFGLICRIIVFKYNIHIEWDNLFKYAILIKNFLLVLGLIICIPIVIMVYNAIRDAVKHRKDPYYWGDENLKKKFYRFPTMRRVIFVFFISALVATAIFYFTIRYVSNAN